MANVVELLQKLISHERSARSIGSIAEAETFATKIQTLLIEHKLSMSEVEYEAQAKDDPINCEKVKPEQAGMKDGTYVEWLALLCTAVAKSLFCQCIYYHGWPRTMIIIGRDSDRQAAAQMYCHLSRIAVSLCEQEFQKYKQTAEYDHHRAAAAFGKTFSPGLPAVGRIWKKSFLLGFAHAIGRRLSTTRKQQVQTASTQALMLIERDELAIDDWMIANRLKAKPQNGAPRPMGQFDHSAAERGRAHGSNVSLKARAALNS
jgi:hypothetical protein